MATITNASLTITHDHEKKLAHTVVTCRVNFSVQEQALMNALPGTNVFKLRCQLWGADSGFFGSDDPLYTSGDVHFFADSTPTLSENRSFRDTVGEGVLDEDIGTDEIYGKIILTNLLFPVTITKKTNEVSHSF